MTDVDQPILELLAAVDDDAWTELAVLAARLAADPAPYRWRGGESMASGAIQMPFVEYGPAVRDVLRWLGRHELVTPLADWTNWYHPDRYPDPGRVAAGPAADAVRLATSVVRGDRFTEGAIAGFVDRGMLGAVLDRLLTWACEERRPPVGPLRAADEAAVDDR